MESITVGLGWNSQGIDLDGSVIMFDKDGNYIDKVVYNKQSSNDGSIRHSGDVTSGSSGSGDIETIKINLKNVSPNIQSLWVVVVVFTSPKTYNDVVGTYNRIFDTNTKKELARFTLTNCRDRISDGNIVSEIYRKGNKW